MGHGRLFFCHMSSIQFVMGHRQEYLLYMTSYHYKQYIIKLYALKAGVNLNLGIEKETLFWSQTRWNCWGQVVTEESLWDVSQKVSNKQTYPCINCTNTGMQGYFFESLY